MQQGSSLQSPPGCRCLKLEPTDIVHSYMAPPSSASEEDDGVWQWGEEVSGHYLPMVRSQGPASAAFLCETSRRTKWGGQSTHQVLPAPRWSLWLLHVVPRFYVSDAIQLIRFRLDENTLDTVRCHLPACPSLEERGTVSFLMHIPLIIYLSQRFFLHPSGI